MVGGSSDVGGVVVYLRHLDLTVEVEQPFFSSRGS